MLYLSCHPLQFLRQLFRGACILVQKRGDPAAGFVGFKGDFLYPLYMIFFSSIDAISFTFLGK